MGLIGSNNDIALAICYELTVPEHAARASQNGARVYIASVSKTHSGIDAAQERLSEIAREYSMTALMANTVGMSDGSECAGRTSVWNANGQLLDHLDGVSEGILVVDADEQHVSKLTA